MVGRVCMAWCQTGHKPPAHRITLRKAVELGHWKTILRTLQKKPFRSLSYVVEFWTRTLAAGPKKEAIVMINCNYSLKWTVRKLSESYKTQRNATEFTYIIPKCESLGGDCIHGELINFYWAPQCRRHNV